MQPVIRRLLLEYDLAIDCMRRAWQFTLALLALTSAAGAQMHSNADAIRLNNRGVALMGQQFTEKAQEAFSKAF